MTDQLYKFMFQAAPVRGELVSLQATWQEVQRRQNYPAAIRVLLGQMLAAAALLSANLRSKGTLIMQMHGDGPVQMLVVECSADLTMRATAKLADDIRVADDADLQSLLNQQGGGRFAITLDPGDLVEGQRPYQSIVPLFDQFGPLPHLSAVLEHYMHASVQLDTRIWLAANHTCAAGLLIQRVPTEGGIGHVANADVDPDAWPRICALGATVTNDEMLTVPPATLVRRLFLLESEEGGMRLADPKNAQFGCPCSRMRVGAMLHMLGKGEVESILTEREKVDIRCEFCGQQYVFDAVDCAQLFHGATAVERLQNPPEQLQ